MDTTKQRLKIAEACGWTRQDVQRAEGYGVLPDYINDLNAMHEAAKALTPEDFERYAIRCAQIADPDTRMGDEAAALTATAAQRAEAFCRVMWPEEWQ